MARAAKIRLSSRAREKLRDLDHVLDGSYGAPEEELGNKQNPLDEAVYIILSFQTDLSRFKQVWTQLRQTFPSWEDLHKAPLQQVARALRVGGLQKQKARTIKGLLKTVRSDCGEFSLDWLHNLEDEEAERHLTKFPGLSWKGARCVLLYSLNRASFPVDGNTFRILKRVGVLNRGAVYRRRGLHDGLQDAVEPERRKSFHVNLVIHGQRACLPRNPRCSICAARSICTMRGVPAGITTVALRTTRSHLGGVQASKTRARG